MIRTNKIANCNQISINNAGSKKTIDNSIIYKNNGNKISHQQETLAFYGRSQILTDNNCNIDLVNEISSLNSNPFGNANKIKNIILQNIGLPEDCIQVEIFDKPKKKSYCDYFNHYSGNILIHRNDDYDTKKLAQIIRHEIEHFLQSLAIVKYYGAEFYKELYEEQGNEIKNEFPTTSIAFNSALWNDKFLQSKTSITKTRCDEYISSIKKRANLAKKSGGIYKYIMENYLYATDPMEIDARKAENKLTQIGGGNPQTVDVNSVAVIEEFEETLNKYLKNNFSKNLSDDERHNIKNDLCLFAFLKMQILNDSSLRLYYDSCFKNGQIDYALRNQLLDKVSNYNPDNIFNDLPIMTKIIGVIRSSNELNFILNTIYSD